MTYIHQEVYGRGEPVVMLHGWAMHSGVWRIFAKQLAAERQVICLDLPGHGRSEIVQPYTLELLVDSLALALPERPCHLVGWSLGGTIALRLAEKYPHKVKSLVLIASNPHFLSTQDWLGVTPHILTEFSSNIKKNASVTLLRFMALQVKGVPEMKSHLKHIKDMLHECAIPELEVLMNGLQILQTADLRGALSALTLPVQMIFGANDTLVPMSVGEQCKSLMPQIEVHVIAEAGHVPFISHSQQVLPLVQVFLLRNSA